MHIEYNTFNYIRRNQMKFRHSQEITFIFFIIFLLMYIFLI